MLMIMSAISSASPDELKITVFKFNINDLDGIQLQLASVLLLLCNVSWHTSLASQLMFDHNNILQKQII